LLLGENRIKGNLKIYIIETFAPGIKCAEQGGKLDSEV
jgi:hypothetical protein